MKKSIFILLFFLAGILFAQQASQYLTEGNRLYQTKDFSSAEKYYRAAVQIDPNSPSAYQGLGNCEFMLGNKKEALVDYEKVQDLAPQSPGVARMVKMLQEEIGKEPARSDLETNGQKEFDIWKANNFELDAMVGVFGASRSNTTGQIAIGVGGGVGFFYFVDPRFSLGLIGSLRVYSNSYSDVVPSYFVKTDESFDYLTVMTVGKYRLGGKELRPYLLLGGGLSIVGDNVVISHGPEATGPFTKFSQGSSSNQDPIFEGGVGFEIPMASNMTLFFEAKYDLILTNVGTSYIAPIDGGLGFLL